MSPEQIYDLALKLKAKFPASAVRAEAYGLTPPSEVVFESLELPDKKRREVTVNLATQFAQDAEPPFEWKLELFFPETALHYLWLVDGRFVRAERKEFFEVTKREIDGIAAMLRKHLA